MDDVTEQIADVARREMTDPEEMGPVVAGVMTIVGPEVERLRKELDKALDRQLEYANRAIANGERAEQARALVETALDLRMHAKRWDRGWNRWDTEAERFLRAPETPEGAPDDR